MNIHILTWEKTENTNDYETIRVFRSFEAIEEINVNPTEALAWLETIKKTPIPDSRSYYTNYPDKEATERPIEYLLTEKQSALFLLRFK